MENTKLFDESIRKLEEVFPLDSNNYKNFIVEFHNLIYGEKFESNDLSSEFVDEVHFSNVVLKIIYTILKSILTNLKLGV